MKTSIKVIIFSLVALIMLTVGLMFAVNYKKESVKYFYNSGYIINNLYDSNDTVNKIYFDADTAYETKAETYSFKNSDGEKVTVNEDKFIHYSDGSIMSLKDGVAIDLDKVDAKLISYYNVFASSIIKKATVGYEINNLNDLITFNKLLFKISNNKYLVAADNITISFADNQVIAMKDYAEIEYIDENVIRIYNADVNYQTISSNLFIIIDNIKMDLEYKTISKNNVKYLTMADMVINSNDNIEILPTSPEKSESDKNGDNSENNPVNNSGENNSNNTTDTELIDELNNITLPNSNEQIDNQNTYIQPKFNVESFQVTSYGFSKLKITVEDKSNVLYGNMTVEILDNSTGKTIAVLNDWMDGTQEYDYGEYFSLEANKSYTLNVTGKYKIDDVIYDRVFVSKVFRTLDIGLKIDKNYTSSDSLSFAIYKSGNSDVTGFRYILTDLNNKEILPETTISSMDSDELIIDTKSQGIDLMPNTEYKLTIYNIKYGSITTINESLKLSYKLKTLKEGLGSDFKLDYDIDPIRNTVKFKLKDLVDINGGIVSYTYKIYSEQNSDPVKVVTTNKNDELELNFTDLDSNPKGKTFYSVAEISFDDNEKTIIYRTEPIQTVIGNAIYPQIVDYIPSQKQMQVEKIDGYILIDDKYNFIPQNQINKYKIVVKEKQSILKTNLQLYEGQVDLEFDTNQIIGYTNSDKTSSIVVLPVILENSNDCAETKTCILPNTDYVIYVYLETDNEEIYLGYELTKTEEVKPINLIIENNSETTGENIFSIKISGDNNSESWESFGYVNFDLYDCFDSVCAQNSKYSNVTIDKNYLEQDEYILNSSEFNFQVTDYESGHAYKIVATGVSSSEKGRYEIPITINGEDNEYVLTILKTPPTIIINPVPIINSDCATFDYCNVNTGLYDETVVGYKFEVSISSGSNTTAELQSYKYEIYPQTDGNCREGFSENAIETNERSTFIKLVQASELKRGEKYCISYQGNYTDAGEAKTTSLTSKTFDIEKQSPKIRGYISEYDGENVNFNIKIDGNVDNTLEKFYLVNRNGIKITEPTEITCDSNGICTFNISTSEKAFVLKLDEYIYGNSYAPQTYSLYEAIMDEIYIINGLPDINFNGDESGKLTVTIKNLKFDRTSALYIGNKAYELSEDTCRQVNSGSDEEDNSGTGSTEICELNINLSDLEEYINDNNELKLGEGTEVRLVYDGGKINIGNYYNNQFTGGNKPIFVKNISDYSNKSKLYFDGTIFKKISKDSVTTLNNLGFTLSQSVNNSKLSESLFYSKNIEHEMIGHKSKEQKVDPITYRVQLNSAEEYIFSDFTNVEVKPVLSTSALKTVYTSSGAKVSFDINSGLKDSLELEVKLFKNGVDSNITIPITRNSKHVSFEFTNLDDDDTTYTYSIYYKYSSSDPFSLTYNDDTNRQNKDIEISKLHLLDIKDKKLEYNNKNWEWTDENKSEIKYKGEIDAEFSIDTDKYELKTGEKINYSIILKAPSLEFEYELDDNNYDEATKKFTKIISNDDLNNKNVLKETYEVLVTPKLITSSGEVALSRNLLGSVDIRMTDPTVGVTSPGTPYFSIAISDSDGVLEACSERQSGSIIGYPGDSENREISRKYFENFNGNKIVYFNLYNSGNTLLGYSPIPFVYANRGSSTYINLENYFKNEELPSGEYKVKFYSCQNNVLTQLGKTYVFNISNYDYTISAHASKDKKSYQLIINSNQINFSDITKVTYQHNNTFYTLNGDNLDIMVANVIINGVETKLATINLPINDFEAEIGRQLDVNFYGLNGNNVVMYFSGKVSK